MVMVAEQHAGSIAHSLPLLVQQQGVLVADGVAAAVGKLNQQQLGFSSLPLPWQSSTSTTRC